MGSKAVPSMAPAVTQRTAVGAMTYCPEQWQLIAKHLGENGLDAQAITPSDTGIFNQILALF